MTKIAIFGGAGTIGSSTAFNIAIEGLADELVLLDVRQNVAAHHAMDINEAVVGLQDVFVRAGSHTDLPGSAVVIIAAGVTPRSVASRMEYLGQNIPIVMDIARTLELSCPDSVVVTATNPVDYLNYLVYSHSSLDRRKLIGYSLNDSIRFQKATADALGIAASRVHGWVIGEHGDSQVPLFSSIRVDGQPINAGDDFKADIRMRVRSALQQHTAMKAGRTSGWTSGRGLTKVVRAIVNDTGETIPCSTILTGEYGYEGLSMGVLCRIGRNGVHEALEVNLTAGERQELQESAKIIVNGNKNAEQILTINE